jgi:hypothetical protein
MSVAWLAIDAARPSLIRTIYPLLTIAREFRYAYPDHEHSAATLCEPVRPQTTTKERGETATIRQAVLGRPFRPGGHHKHQSCGHWPPDDHTIEHSHMLNTITRLSIPHLSCQHVGANKSQGQARRVAFHAFGCGLIYEVSCCCFPYRISVSLSLLFPRQTLELSSARLTLSEFPGPLRHVLVLMVRTHLTFIWTFLP